MRRSFFFFFFFLALRYLILIFLETREKEKIRINILFVRVISKGRILLKKKKKRKKDKNPPVTGHNNMAKGIHDLRDTRNLSFDLKEREEMKILSQTTRNLIFASVEQRKTPVTRK